MINMYGVTYSVYREDDGTILVDSKTMIVFDESSEKAVAKFLLLVNFRFNELDTNVVIHDIEQIEDIPF